jgi:DNA-directed RNA polymerase specialized sigma24 family protein
MRRPVTRESGSVPKVPDPVLATLDEPFARLYREEAPRLWRAVFALTRSSEIASDAVAEAFAQCLRRGDGVREPRAWVWRAAFAIARGELKDRNRWVPLGARTRQRATAGGPWTEVPSSR